MGGRQVVAAIVASAAIVALAASGDKDKAGDTTKASSATTVAAATTAAPSATTAAPSATTVEPSPTTQAPATSAEPSTTAAPSGPAADVAITACADSENGFLGPEATLTITNNSSKTSNYIITIAFESPDGATQIDTGSAFVNNLGPGQSTTKTASSLQTDRGQEFVCRVADVSRFAA